MEGARGQVQEWCKEVGVQRAGVGRARNPHQIAA